MGKSDAISKIIEEFKEPEHIEQKIVPTCEFCGKDIVGSKWNKEYHHINICQEPKKRFFCSRQCKLKWVFKNF